MATKVEQASERRAYWEGEIDKAKKRWRTFWDEGTRVVDDYRQQAADGNARASKDKYNILYSSTETIRPNLYSQLPTVRVVLRNKDNAPTAARDGAELLQNCGQYLIEENDLDTTMDSVVEDLLLPGMGQGWVRYEPNIEYQYDAEKKPVLDPATGEQVGKLLDEQVCLEYVFWQDFLTGAARSWQTVPWVAKCCWMTKEKATKRFGAKKANMLTYSARQRDAKEPEDTADTAEVWEIWDKRTRMVSWYSPSYSGDLLDQLADPLQLKNFWPCPRPLRAISTNGRITPRSLYSQYKDQAEQVNNLTRRIRLLTDALKVAGVYNGAEENLKDLLSPNSGNKMIGVQNWAGFKGDGGILGAIEWLPLNDVVNALNQLLAAREVAKAEIYEITGFSDILRGVSKASETLGAQNIKANWGGARLKRMQKEVQRFARDMISIASEIVSEHCSEESIALFGGLQIPDDPKQAEEVVVRFKAALNFIRNEGKRLAAIDVETDSTILADETAERADRTAFLAAAGAFLQQAVPAMEATPELGPLLGAMLLFTVRTFPSSRVIEDAFEQVTKSMANRPPKQPEQPDQTKVQAAQIAAKSAQELANLQAQTKQAEIAAKERYESQRVAVEQQSEQNRHDERMNELSIKAGELDIKQQELDIKAREQAIKEAELAVKQDAQVLDETVAEHDADMDTQQLELQYDELDQQGQIAREQAAAAERQESLTDKSE